MKKDSIIAVSGYAGAVADKILGQCGAFGGTFDPNASPLDGGYALTTADAAEERKYDVKIAYYTGRGVGYVSRTFKARTPGEAENAARSYFQRAYGKDFDIEHVKDTGPASAYGPNFKWDSDDENPTRDDGAFKRIEGLKEDLAATIKHLERAIRNKDAEAIRDYREEKERLTRQIAAAEGRGDDEGARADAAFKPGDYVMDRDTQKMGVVAEVDGRNVTVDWKDGRRTTVNASTLKG